ncbi:MAG: sugar transferase [Parachlamydiaceae bacterium]|nr:sugar transferase [Parachlamydiaceae bacterium]
MKQSNPLSPVEVLEKSNVEKLTSSIKYQIKHIPIKRIFDILFSICALIIGFPIYLIIASIIFCYSPGGVFYSHQRIGRGGKPFACYKFRSMYPDADARLKHILATDPILKVEWELNFKLKNDPRIMPIGTFLRKTSLDELPQFWNVLKGDLSVVGPRPVIQEEVDKYLSYKAPKILSIRPGLTGPWQVSGRSGLSYQKRIELDEFYIDNQSLLLDIKLIAKTIPVMLFSKGAY